MAASVAFAADGASLTGLIDVFKLAVEALIGVLRR